MMHGQTPEEKMPEHLRPAYKATKIFTQGTMNILTEHGADLLALAQAGGMVYETLHTPANISVDTSINASSIPTREQNFQQQCEKLKDLLPEKINLPKPEEFLTQVQTQHRIIKQKALIDVLKEKIATTKVTPAIASQHTNYGSIIPLLHQDYLKHSTALHKISLAERVILAEQNKTISKKIAVDFTIPQLQQSGFIEEIIPAIIPHIPSGTVSNLLYGFASHSGKIDPFEKEEWLQTVGKDVIGTQTISGSISTSDSNQTVSAGTNPFTIFNFVRDTVNYVLHPRESRLIRIQASRKNRTDGNIRVDNCGIIHQSTSAEEQTLHDIASWAQDCLNNPDTSSKAKLHAKQILQQIHIKEQAEAIIQKNGARKVDSNVIRNAKKSTQQIERLKDTLSSEIGTSPGNAFCMYMNDTMPDRQTRRDSVRQCVRYEKKQCIKRKQELVAIIETYNKNCSTIRSESNIKEQTRIVWQAQKELSSINSALANMAGHDAVVAIHEKSPGNTTDYGTQWYTDSTYDFLGSTACKQFEHQYNNALHYDGKHPVIYANTSQTRAQASSMYNLFRKSHHDVRAIAKNTGISEEVVQQIKNHLLIDQHALQDSNGHIVKKRFDPNINIANTWQRLVDGTYIDADLNLLKHEYHESYLMKEKGLSYPEAHKIASGEVEQGLSNKRAIEKPNVPTKFVTPIDNQPKPTTT
ncbi:MAG TPA: hypothetical protein VGW78_03405, partial [Candidatus Babeliales bacterium]|nr:hypothetical protein [Candidatus Babeliales bacterium]